MAKIRNMLKRWPQLHLYFNVQTCLKFIRSNTKQIAELLRGIWLAALYYREKFNDYVLPPKTSQCP